MRWLFAPIVSIAALAACDVTQPTFDVIVRGGLLYDGFAEAQRMDLGITGDCIAAIGDLSGASAAQQIDASGLAVAPGFIDVQSRAGLTLMADGVAENLLHQGVTSVILGDRDSPAFAPSDDARVAELRPFGAINDWTGFDEYFERLLQRGVTVNVGTLAPLARLDTAAAVDAALAQGALGVSVAPQHAAAAPATDLAGIARVIAERDAVLALQPAGTLDDAMRALTTLGTAAAQTQVRLLVFQPSIDDSSTSAIDALVTQIRAMRTNGVNVLTSATPGLSASETGRWFVQSGAAVGSQAESLRPQGPHSRRPAEPSAYDAFSRVVAVHVREEQAMPIAVAIRRMTSDPATYLRLDGRGALREGYVADVVVFDPTGVQGQATPSRPHQLSAGVQYVIVAGVPVLDPRGLTGARPGRALYGRSRAGAPAPVP